MNGLAPWLGVARAPFLLLPVTLVAAGAAAAAYEGAFGWGPTLLALVGLVLLHAAVNALNEASDMTTGIDLRTTRTPFSGGSGTLPAGRLSVRATRVFAYACALVGGLIGGWFALQLGPMFALLMAVGAASVLFYSDFFARSGLGEVFAGLGLGALPVWGAAWVQGRPPGPAALWAGVPAFLMTFNLLLLNEFPDEEADRAGGRRNIVLLLGRKGAALVYAAAALLTPAAIVAAVAWEPCPRRRWRRSCRRCSSPRRCAGRSGTRASPCRSPPSAPTSPGTSPPTPCWRPRSSWPSSSADLPALERSLTVKLRLLPLAALAVPALLAAAVPAGFTPLFNGKDLTGWHISQTNHHGNSKGWSVKDGVVLATQDRPGNGGILLTDRKYRDFEVSLEVNPDWGCDGGLFLRSNEAGDAYQVMIDYLEGGSVGGIYGEGLQGVDKGERVNKDWAKHWKKGEWNTLRARIEGDVPHIRVWLNEAPLVDWTDTANHAKDGATEGMIALQMHFSNEKTPRWKEGGFHRFRNVAVKELPR